MVGPDASAARSLRRIADILGIPVERLFDGATPAELADADRCMRLWYAIRTDAGRRAALAALRKVLEEEGG